ncbi:MAG: GH3 auxin-responsive promoter, partial [Methylophilaceae bacterium]|nr:GH3 auxin-responsive promoter [Methylophilaceae bacterium]
MIGDLVRFINVEDREIKITGRIKQFLSLAGEHLSLDNINSAIDKVSAELSCTISEFCIVADQEKMYQQWYFGTSDNIESEKLMQ